MENSARARFRRLPEFSKSADDVPAAETSALEAGTNLTRYGTHDERQLYISYRAITVTELDGSVVFDSISGR